MEYKSLQNWLQFWKEVGFSVDTEGFPEDSGIAYNDTFCIPFTVRPDGCISAVSFIRQDMNDIKERYKGKRIGFSVFEDYMNNTGFTHFGYVCNHDHSMGEIRMAVERTTEHKF